MNIVLITSVINTPNLPLSYSKIRSVYNSNERYDQTKKTILSVKNKIPNNKIFIIECSILTEEQENYLKEESDYFLNLYTNHYLCKQIFGLSKSLGEGTMTNEALKFLINNKIKFNNLFKISGRYWLSEKFKYNNFNNNSIIVKKINNNIDNIFTALYKIPYKEINNLHIFLQQNIDKMEKCIGYEVLFSSFIENICTNTNTNINFINSIGLQGNVTVCGTFYDG